jgi:cytochrome c biogenesis protein CcmG, thiol:disulfide interchange protein DsbE
MSWDRNDCTS